MGIDLGFKKRKRQQQKKYSIRMSNTISYSVPQQEAANSTARQADSPELKLYQAFIFSVPVFFTFVLLFLFYLFYLRYKGVDWNSLRMRTSSTTLSDESDDSYSRPWTEMGLKKEVREMLPIIVFKESFSVNDTQCSVCLGDYQAEEKLQQIPSCGHTFHVECIDNWLSTRATCPLCRQSLVSPSSAKDEAESSTTELVLVVQQIDNNRATSEDNLNDDDAGGSPNRNSSQQRHDDDCCSVDQRILNPWH